MEAGIHEKTPAAGLHRLPPEGRRRRPTCARRPCAGPTDGCRTSAVADFDRDGTSEVVCVGNRDSTPVAALDALDGTGDGAIEVFTLGTRYEGGAARGTPVAAYVLDEAGSRTLAQVLESEEHLDAGEASNPALEFVFAVADARHGVVIVAGDDGTGAIVKHDCDEANNEVAWALDACP